jgi:hypothetical protein
MAFLPLFFATPAMAEDVVPDPIVIVVTEPVVEPVVTVVNTPGGDDSSYQVPLTTTVTFDGVVYDQVYATTNSVITFGRPDGTYWAYPATPSISLYSMDWVVFPWARPDEHLTIAASDGGFQVDISARPIWLQQATEPTNINIVAAINTDGTVSISYSLTGPTYEGQTRTGVRLTNGDVVTLEEYGVVRVEEPPVLEPEPVVTTPTPTPTPESTDTPVDPTPTPTPEPTMEPTPTPTPETTVQPIPRPTIPEGATVISEGTSIEVIAPAGQRIVSVMAWYGDPDDATRGIDVSSVITQLASGQTSVTIDSDNRYGDPAGGTVKVLIFLPIYEQIPAPEPTPEPTPTLPPVVVPEPTQTPTPEPTPAPQPAPQPAPEPVPVPSPEPVPPVVEPEPPVVEPEPPITEPEPQPEPAPEPPAEPEPQPPVEPEPALVPAPEPPTEKEAVEEISNLVETAPEDLTDAQVGQLVEAAMVVFETADQGSPAYEQALEALAVAAEADDAELPSELAAIPLLGDAAGAALEVFNNLGNVGADMAPAVREEAEKTVIASVIATGAAVNAVAAATTAASSTSTGSSGGGSSGGSSGGSGSTRRKL